MKKLLILLLPAILLISCVSIPMADANGFYTDYDDVREVTTIEHDYFKNAGMLYNLKDSITGERENLDFLITNDFLFVVAKYQYNSWAFIDSLVFIGSGKKIKIALPDNSRNAYAGYIREICSNALSNNDAIALREILQDPAATVSFLGSKRDSEKLKINRDLRDAAIKTIDKYLELNK